MSDLTFLDNGNPNLHADGLINFSKCRLIYNRIRDLVLRQVRDSPCVAMTRFKRDEVYSANHYRVWMVVTSEGRGRAW